MDEREAKFDLDTTGELPDLSGVIAGAVVVERPQLGLRAKYYDTVDLRLLRRGVTLRHRRELSGLGEDRWTLKVPGATGGATFDRTERSWPARLGVIPDEAVHLVAGLTLGAPLVPVAELSTVRSRRELRDADGRRLAEIDDDRVSVIADTTTRFRQVEVELDAGGEQLIAAVAKRLRKAGGTRSADEPKVQRALADRLADLEGTRRPARRQGQPTVGQVVVAGLARGLDGLVANDLGVRLDDGRAVHQARVAARRLRAELQTYRGALDPLWVAEVRADLRWVAGALGAVRDADVLAARLADAAWSLDPDDAAAFAEVDVRLVMERDDALRHLHDVLASTRYLDLLRRLEQAVDTPPWRPRSARQGIDPGRRAAKVVGPLVHDQWRSVRRASARLGDGASDQDMHALRLKAKRLRYAAESAGPILGPRAWKVAARAESAQSTLGDHHDAVNAEAWLRAAAADVSPSAAVAVGLVLAAERRAQREGRVAWAGVRAGLADKKLGARLLR